MSDFSVSLRVNVEVSDIQSQLNAIRPNPLDLDVQLNTKNLQSQINSLRTAPVDINLRLNDNQALNQVANIRRQLQELSNIRIDIGGRGGRGGRRQIDETTQSYNELMRILNEINSKRIRLNGLDATAAGSANEIQTLLLQIQQLETSYDNLLASFDAQGIQFTADQWTRMQDAIAKTGRQIDVVQSRMADRNVTEQQTRAYRELLSISKEMGSLELDITKLRGQGGNTNQIEVLEGQLRELQTTYQQLVANMNTPLTNNQWSSIYTQIAQTTDKIAQLQAQFADARASMAQGITDKLNAGGFDNEVSKIISDFDRLSNQSAETKTAIGNLRNSLVNIRTAAQDGDINALINANQEYARSLRDVENQLKMNKRAERDAFSADILQNKKAGLLAETKQWLKDNSAAAAQFGDRIKEIQVALANCRTDSQFGKLSSDFTAIKKEAKEAGVATQTFGDKLKAQFEKYSAYLSVASLFMYATQGLKDMFNQVIAIDTAMTELKKVTNESNESYNDFLGNAASRAKEIGTTIDGLVTSTADFARLGYDFKQAQGLAEVANIYTVVGDEIDGVEGATQSLISTMTAFKGEMNDMSDSEFAMNIVDKFNEVSNNFAISSGGIGKALQRSASSMAAAGNTLDETIALTTAANTVVQDPDAVGTAFKTISMRIRGAKTELEEAGLETDGMVDSTAKLREEIMALTDVDIMENDNQFKSTYKIMDELAAKWQDLSDIQQATVTELIAGKRQGNIVSSLMNNFDIAREALETSANSSGSAMEEHAKWSDSLEARLLKLKATWQSLSQSFLSSSFLKGGISGITGFVNALDGLINKVGALPTLLSTFAGGLSLFKNKGIFTFDKDAESIKMFGDTFSELGNKYEAISTKINKYNSLNSQHQLQFCESMKTSSTNFGKYISGLNGGKASISGYVASLVKAKVATFALQAATIAMNAALTMGISALISWGVSAISKWINQAEELAEKVDEITTKYKDQHSELMKLKSDYDTTNEDSMISKYGELSKGVDDFGKNLSLTADEYAEYQNIVSTIAGQIPSLVSGYDSQGNAILSCANNIEQLTAAYEDLIHTQNQEILTNTGSIEDVFANTVEKQSGTHWWTNGHGFWKAFDFLKLADYELKDDTASVLNDLLDAKKDRDQILSDLRNQDNGYSAAEIRTALEDAGVDIKWHENVYDKLEDTLKKEPQKIKGIVDNYYSQFSDDVEQQKAIAQAKLSEAFDISEGLSGLNYSNISEKLQSIAYQTVNGLDYNFFSKLKKQNISVEEWTTGMLDQLNNLKENDVDSIETAFDLKTQFNGGDISYGEYVGGLKEVNDLVGNLVDQSFISTELGDTIKNALNINGVLEQYEALSNFLQNDLNFDESGAESFLNSLSAEEFAVLMDIKPELDANATASEIQDMIDKEMAMRGLTVKLDIEVEKANIEAVTTALSEMVTGAGMSSESISAVENMFKGLSSYDSAKLFERTANGIRLNREEFNKLNSEYSKTNLAELNREMSSLGDIYNRTREELYGLAYGTDEYNSKLADLNNIEGQINATEKLISQYQGLASAYQQWQIAESTGNERDMYENVISGMATVKDELSRGWVDSGTREFIELLKGETATIVDGDGTAKEIDIATASAKELKQVWDDLDKTIEHTGEGGKKGYSIKDFFTTDKDGNSTSKGVYNFLDAIGHMEEEVFGGADIVKRDSKGNIIGFNLDLVGGDEVIAEALGVSEELVQIMVRAAGDAGFVVSFDGTFQQLDVLREKAQLAAESMNEILEKDGKKTIEIDMNASKLEDIEPQIKSIMDVFGKKDGSGAIDMSIKGAEQALTVVSTLQSMKDRLERPAYMNIQTSQVEDNLKEPLQNLQDYRTGIEQLNQAKLHGADTTELETSIKESKDKIVADLQEIQESNPELAAELKIDGLSESEIASKVENNEITIPASIEVQMSIDDKLGILADKALLDAGIIKPEEFKKRVDVYLDASADNDDAKETVNNAVNEVTECADGDTATVTQDVEVETGEVKTDGFMDKAKRFLHKLLYGWNTEPVETETDVSVDVGNVDTTSAEESVKTGAEGRLNGIGIDVDADVNVDANVNTSNAENEVQNKTKEAVESQSGETTTLEKDVQLEFNINDYVDELSKFKDVAKELEGLEDVSVKINVNLEGELDSDKVAKLKEFAEGAKELSGASNKDVSIKANFEGNLSDGKGIENLAQFAKGAKELNGAKSSEITITANFDGSYLDATSDNINNLTTFADGAKKLNGVENIDISVIANLDGTLGSWTGNIDDLTTFAEQAKALQGVKNSDVTVNANIEGNITNESVARLESFATAIAKLPTSAVNINVKANVDTGSIESAISILQRVANSGLLQDYNASVTVKYNKDSSEPDNYIPEDKDAFVRYHKESSEVDGYDPPNLTRYVTYYIRTVGGAGAGGGGDIHAEQAADQGWYYANGTAHANGTAFAGGTAESGKAFKSGNWATKESGVALMGELGRELIVRDGRFFTVGDEGAGFFPYKRGDIIFNHKQTEELFKNGYVTSNGGRGKALASGTAFSEGTAFSSGTGGGLEPSVPSVSSNSKSSNENGDDVETVDWIEILIDRIERSIDHFDKVVNNTFKTWEKRGIALTDKRGKIEEELKIQQQAYDRYMEEAISVGLQDGTISAKAYAQNGAIEIIDYSKDNKEAIDEFLEWYNKALDCKDAIDDLNISLSETYKIAFDAVVAQYDGFLAVIEHQKSLLDEYINQSEAQGWLVSAKYYDFLVYREIENIGTLEDKRIEMVDKLNESLNSGKIERGSEAYDDMVKEIDDVTLSIEESKTAIDEYNKSIQELKWEQFDLLQDRISAITDETKFLIDLMSNEQLHDDNGRLTDDGKATMGLHGVAYNVNMAQADQVAAEIKRLEKEMKSDPYDKELEERYREMVKLQQDYILSAEDEKEAIRNLVEEGINLELDALQERIDKYNEAIENQKNLYEYQKKVKEQTKEIADLQKLMSAYEGDDSEETKAKVQELKVSLEEAKADLEETEYDKYISDQQKLLDDLYLEYETVLNTRLDNIDMLIADMIAEINTDATAISDTISEKVGSVGYELSESMKTIWDTSSTNINNVITTYGDKFNAAQTTTNTALNNISADMKSMLAKLDNIADKNIKTAKKSSASNVSSSKTSSTSTNNKNSSGGDGTPKEGDKVKFVSGQYYYDSYGKKPLGSQNQGKYVYITNINKQGSHPYHISTGKKLGDGDLGWLKLNQISGYYTGKEKFFDDESAWTQENKLREFIVRPSDGAILTPIAKGDSVLNAQASRNIWDMANSPTDFIRNNLGMNTANVPNNQSVHNNYTQHLENVVFSLPNVKNYDELLSDMQKDKKFEKLVLSMTIDRVTGGSSLAKGKVIK